MKSSTHIGKTLLLTTFLLMLILTQMALAKASPATQVKVEPHENIAQVGESFTINITLVDVRNLYGIEVILRWDPSLLQVVGVDVHLGVESYPEGVLHEDILIAKNETRNDVGRYWLAATSTAPADSFNGSGNIVTITFNVTNVGSCRLDLETELRGKPPPGDIAPLVEHKTVDGFFGRETPEQPNWGYVTTIVVILVVLVIAAIVVVYRKKSKS